MLQKYTKHAHIILYIPTIFFLVALLMISRSAVAANADDAREFVDGIGRKVLDVINVSSLGKEEKQKKLQQMFSQNVDMQWMAQFVLGGAWKQATAEQRENYIKPYREYMLARYTTRFSDYTGAKYTITDVKSEADGQFVVNMQIKAPKQTEETSAGYRVLADSSGNFKIVDIIIEGVSLINTQRSEFASVVQQKGIDGLIENLKNKTGEEKQKPAKSSSGNQ